MKNYTFFITPQITLRFLLGLALSLFALTLFGQTDTETPVNYPELYSALVGALTMAWGYVAKALGLKKEVKRFVFVVIAGAVVIVGIFLALGFGNGISHAIAVLTSMGIFDLLKGATKDTEEK